MHKRVQNVALLVVVLVLAAALTAVASSRVTARSSFQVSPPDARSPLSPIPTTSPSTPVATLPPVIATLTPTEVIQSATATALPTIPLEPPPPAQPALTPVAPIPTAASPTVPGFLPAPTLTNPDELRNNPPAVYRPNAAAPEPTTEPAPTPITVGGLVREGIVALSYLWLCVGAILLVGMAIAIVWLARRAARRSPPHV